MHGYRFSMSQWTMRVVADQVKSRRSGVMWRRYSELQDFSQFRCLILTKGDDSLPS